MWRLIVALLAVITLAGCSMFATKGTYSPCVTQFCHAACAASDTLTQGRCPALCGALPAHMAEDCEITCDLLVDMGSSACVPICEASVDRALIEAKRQY